MTGQGDPDPTGVGLARFLTEATGQATEVSDLRMASAGARRRNVLFTATAAGERRELVATIIPTADVQIQPVSVEAGAIRLGDEVGMPVATVVGDSDDPSWVGGPFFVSTRVDGESVPRQILRLVEADPSLGPMLARQCGAALARLHAAPLDRAPAGMEGPTDDQTPASFAIEVLREQMDELLQPSATFELAYRWLRDTAPGDDRVAVVHGDFRNGNLMVGPDGLRAVFDWEGSRLGAPMSDLAWMTVRMWRFRNDELPVGGFAAVDDLRAGYEQAGGTWDDATYHWWKVLGTFRWGLGLAGQARQHLDGKFPSIVMAASGRRVAEMEHDVLMLLRGAWDRSDRRAP
ncbi:MAG: phosphotransferase family protein [Actinomycetota bacterium]